MIQIDDDRRLLMQMLALGALGAGTASGASAQPARSDQAKPASNLPAGPKPKVAILVHPKMILIDFVGPATVLNICQCEIFYVWKTLDPIPGDLMQITPNATFDTCPKDLDVLFVPGGLMGSIAAMNDPEILEFLADRGSRARYVTSICTGTLVLAAAGLLRGYKATGLWTITDILPIMGVIPAKGRVVEDRNRITGAGATAGLDWGLVMAARLRGEEAAKRAQLLIEYAPKPPFHAGTPEEAGPEMVAEMKAGRAGMEARARTAAVAAAKGFAALDAKTGA